MWNTAITQDNSHICMPMPSSIMLKKTECGGYYYADAIYFCIQVHTYSSYLNIIQRFIVAYNPMQNAYI